MDIQTLHSSIVNLVAPIFSDRGVELVELSLKGSRQRRLVRIYADRPEGITIDECSRLSRELADLLDTHNPIDGSYVLEVSSPGLDRPLETHRDFQRALGKDVKMQVEGLGEFLGRLEAAEDTDLVVRTADDVVTLPRSQVLKAHLHYEI